MSFYFPDHRAVYGPGIIRVAVPIGMPDGAIPVGIPPNAIPLNSMPLGFVSMGTRRPDPPRGLDRISSLSSTLPDDSFEKMKKEFDTCVANTGYVMSKTRDSARRQSWFDKSQELLIKVVTYIATNSISSSDELKNGSFYHALKAVNNEGMMILTDPGHRI
jgi:hypothetical protein